MRQINNIIGSNWLDFTTLINGKTIVWYFDEDSIKTMIL